MSFYDAIAVDAARRLNEVADDLLNAHSDSEVTPGLELVEPAKFKARTPLNERPVPRGQQPINRPLMEGEWVRASWYTEGHRVCRDLRTALCGRPLDLHLHKWVVPETRKTGRCSYCNNGKNRDMTQVPQAAQFDVVLASQVSRLPVSTEGRKSAIEFESKVALVKRLLGATEV